MVSPNGRPVSKLPPPRIRADQRKSLQGPAARLKPRSAKSSKHCNYTQNSDKWFNINDKFIRKDLPKSPMAKDAFPQALAYASASRSSGIATRALPKSRDQHGACLQPCRSGIRGAGNTMSRLSRNEPSSKPVSFDVTRRVAFWQAPFQRTSRPACFPIPLGITTPFRGRPSSITPTGLGFDSRGGPLPDAWYVPTRNEAPS